MKQGKMKIFNRILSGMLIIAMVFTLVAATAFADDGSDSVADYGGSQFSYTITLVDSDENTLTDITDVSITISSGDASYEMTVDEGVASYTSSGPLNAADTAYTVNIDNIIGYEFSTDEDGQTIDTVTFSNSQNGGSAELTLVEMPSETRTISGTVTYEGGSAAAEISAVLTGYGLGDEGITAVSDDNGQYTFENVVIYDGENYEISFSLDDKYESVDPITVSDDADYNVVLKVKTFEVSVSVTDSAGGSASLSSDETVVSGTYSYGEDVYIYITPDEHYEIKSVNNADYYSAADDDYIYKISEIKEDTDVTVEFALVEYSVTITVFADGTVSYETGNGSSGTADENSSVEVSVSYGNNITVIADPAEGYHVSSVEIYEGEDAEGTEQIDQESVSNDLTYEGSLTVTSDTKITVTFEINTYNITVSQEEIELEDETVTGEVILEDSEGNEIETVNYGGSAVLKITPPSGYNIESVIVTEGDEEEDITNSLEISEDYTYFKYTLSEIKDNVAVAVEYSEIETVGEENAGNYVKIPEPDYSSGSVYYYNDTAEITAENGYEILAGSSYVSEYEVSGSTDGALTLTVFDGIKWYCVETGITFVIDRNAPVIEITGGNNEAWTNEDVIITGTVTDSESGVAGLYYVDSDGQKVYASSGEGSSFVVDDEGNFTITFSDEQSTTYTLYAADNVGNETDGVMLYAYIDKSASVIRITGGNDGTWTNEDVVITGTVVDAANKVESLFYKDEDGNEVYASSEENSSFVLEEDGSFTITFSGEQSTTYTLYAEDDVGNITDGIALYVNIDETAPEVDSFEVSLVESSGLKKVLNILSFGNFFNSEVEIAIGVSDSSDSGAAVSGAEKVNLYADGEELETVGVSGDKAVFKIDEAYFSAELSVTVSDEAGNTSEVYSPSEITQTNVSSNEFMYETTAPDVKISMAEPVYTYTYSGTVENWYSSSVEFTVSVKDILEVEGDADSCSGIGQVEISLNGTVLVNEDYSEGESKLLEKTFEVDTDEAEANDDGSYTISVTVADNAGNERTAEETIYIDTEAPEIISFSFADEDGKEVENMTEDNASDEEDKDEDYAYYFGEDVTVTISAEDEAPSSGIEAITYYLYDVNSGEGEYIEAEVNDENEIEFTLSADFKGYIYAEAIDNAGNTTGYFVSPDGAILETKEQHEESSSIEFSVADENEDNYYNEDVEITVTVADTYSGIKTIDWSLSSSDEENDQSGTESDDDWEVTGEDKNLVTEMKKTITVSSNSDDITLTVSFEDNAGNTSEEEYVLNIDKTSPEISVSYDNNDAENEKYFSAGRTAAITVTERNFDPDKLNINIEYSNESPVISSWTCVNEGSGNGDDETWTATVTYAADGVYTFDISYTDAAGNSNKTVDYGSSAAPTEFTVDKTEPEGTITALSAEGSSLSWSSLRTSITYAFYSNSQITVTGTSYDETSPIYSVEYYKVSSSAAADNTAALTEEELDGVTDWQEFESLEITSDEQFVVYLKITDYAGNYEYISTNGLIVDTDAPVVESISPEITISPEQPVNDIYSGDVDVEITVTDPLTGGTYSGLALITYEVLNMGEVTQTGELYSFENDDPDQSDLEQTWTGTIQVDSDLNDSNDVEIIVYAADNAGNTSSRSKTIQIDITAPAISVSYDNNSANSGSYFNAVRTATITITERNFDADDVVITITAEDAYGNAIDVSYLTENLEWETTGGSDVNDVSHTTTITFDEDANYTFDISYTDEAGNESEAVDYGSSIAPTEFTVDKTAPTGTVTIGTSFWSSLLSVLTFGLYSRNPVQIEAEADDATSPYIIEYYVYSESEFIYDDGELHVLTAGELDQADFSEYEDFTYEGDDQFVIYLKITDYAGNYTYVSSDGYVIDSTASVIEYKIETDKSENGIYTEDVVISYSVNDEDSNGSYSGIKTVSWTVTSGGTVTQEGSTDFSEDSPSYSELEKYIEDEIIVDCELNNRSDVVVSIETEDSAGNTESVDIELDIDVTAPEISVSYNNNDAENEKYFDEERTATIVITERTDHFDADDVVITITAEDAYGNDIDVSYLTEDLEWTTTEDSSDVNGAEHTAIITFEEDANYTFDISYTDKAGLENTAVDTGSSVAPYEFTVDKTAPMGTVTAVTSENVSKTWDELRTSITYGFYAKSYITITGTSDDATSPVYSVEYYKITSSEASDNTAALTGEELDTVTSWQAFDSLSITSDEQFVVYLKITDYAGNYTFISTNGLIVDENAPVETISPEITISPEQPVNDIYSGDVDVEITVTDPLTGGTYSGIALITYEVLNMGEVTQSGTLYSFGNDDPDQSDLEQSWSGTITVDADLNNSNDVEIIVYAQDNAGNTSDQSENIQIDVTAPVISVSYDNNSADSGSYFNAARTATITITERNFDADDVEISITNTDGTIPSLSGWTKSSGSGNEDNTTWTATITYSADGDYTFDIAYTDEAGNKAAAADYGSSVQPEEFTIDRTDPVITVSYSNNEVANGSYFSESRTMTITIVEHNFDVSRVEITQTASLDGSSITAPSVTWSSSGDVHTGTIVYDSDGDYTFDISMTDMAGNSNSGVNYTGQATQAFTIDTTRYTDSGTAIITGVENGAAYADEVIPAIYFDDVNYQTGSVVITLLRTRKDEIDVDVTDEFITGNYTETSRGVDAVFDTFDAVKDNDGIYTLSVYYLDLAGNEVEESVTFSVNRFGSVYVYSNDLVDLISDGGAYVQTVEGRDLVITEYNPDQLVEDSLTIEITLDGKPVDEVVYTVSPTINTEAQTGSSGWYQYEYVISEENFASDGVYKITLSSTDAAGNTSENSNEEAYDEIIFRIDTTAPEITSVSGLESSIINAAEQTIEYVVYDTIGLESVQIIVTDADGEITLDETAGSEDFGDDINNYTSSFTIGEGINQTVRIIVTDKAGNVTDTAAEGFAEAAAYTYNSQVTVSSNFFVRWYANTVLFWISIAVIVVVIGLVIFFILFKKRKKEDEENKGTSAERNKKA